MRLFEIARAIEAVGSMALPRGTSLQSLHLVVPVARKPSHDLREFWLTEVVRQQGRLARALGWLHPGGHRSGAAHHVRISWIEGRMTGAILREPSGRNRSNS